MQAVSNQVFVRVCRVFEGLGGQWSFLHVKPTMFSIARINDDIFFPYSASKRDNESEETKSSCFYILLLFSCCVTSAVKIKLRNILKTPGKIFADSPIIVIQTVTRRQHLLGKHSNGCEDHHKESSMFATFIVVVHN